MAAKKYTVSLYQNTHFNSVNVPDSPALLDSIGKTDIEGFELVQVHNLSSVRIRTYGVDITDDYDYCKITDSASVFAYYFITDVKMLSVDTAELFIVEDYLTTLGGPAKLNYLDGITVRCHPKDNKISYFEEDEYMSPTQPLEVEQKYVSGYGTSDKSIVAVESTIDLVTLGLQFDDNGNFNGKGMRFTDPIAKVTKDSQIIYDSTGKQTGKSITEKEIPASVQPYMTGVKTNTKFYGYTGSVLAPGTCLYDTSKTIIKRALGAVRTLGRESCILNQYVIPDTCSVNMTAEGEISAVHGNQSTASLFPLFPYLGSASLPPKLSTGKYNSVGMVSTSGESMEYLPEQIYDGKTADVIVDMTCDPRPDGKPYFRFQTIYGSQAKSVSDYMKGSISGGQWPTAPLVYTTASGSYMDKINYKARAGMQQAGYGYGQNALSNEMYYSLFSSLLGGMTDLASLIGSSGGSFPSAILNYSQREGTITAISNQRIKNELQYQIARENELANYGFSQSVPVPEVVVGFNSNYMRDFAGNGVLVYRYKYTNQDQQRIGRLLTMYGYKLTKPLVKTDFEGRAKFNYVRAIGVSIGGDNSRLLNEGAAAQLAVGVRVWHVRPDTRFYRWDQNPIKETTNV